MNVNDWISKNQICFKDKCRTSDHIFTVKSIIDHYKSKQKVFAAFIDLRKAFDTVWHFINSLNEIFLSIFITLYMLCIQTQTVDSITD